MSDAVEPVQLEGGALETWSAFATVLEWLPAALDAQLRRDSDLTHFEYGVLFALGAASDHCARMSVLAGHANSSLSRLSRAITRLEARRWVTRATDPTDGRYMVATLTDAGVEKLRVAAPGHAREVNRLVLEPLTAAQRRQLLAISLRVTRAIRDESGWRPSDRS